MSKYPVSYRSASKGEVEIEKMHDLHLLNAYRKLRDSEEPSARLLDAMEAELKERELDPAFPDGKPGKKCEHCEGSGRIRDEHGHEDRCDKCHGTGRAA